MSRKKKQEITDSLRKVANLVEFELDSLETKYYDVFLLLYFNLRLISYMENSN